MLKKWLAITNVRSVSLHTVICGLHFKQSDYTNLDSKTRRLKKHAVPSLNLSESTIENYELMEVLSDEENNDTISANHKEKIDEYEILQEMDEPCPVNSENVNTVESDSVIEEERKSVATQTIFKTNCCTEKSVQTERYSFLHFLMTDNNLNSFTGINHSILDSLSKCILLIENKTVDKHLCSLKERIVLTLCKLKLNMSFDCIATLFQLSKSTACNYFGETIHLLHAVLEEAIHFPDKLEIQENLPYCFKNFKNTRIILDCTEVAVQQCKCLQCRMKTYSHYKGKLTLKILIGVTPSGLILYCSECFGGRASDKIIFSKSGLLNKLTPGEDAIMVDKGFLIKDLCDAHNIQLIRPPFADKNQQMSFEDCLKNRGVASARVHVEKVIERIKNFQIMKSTIEWEMVKYFDKIVVIICGIVNLNFSILGKDKFL